ncbi:MULTISPECIES: STAS-like domain-containing protein [unclassified Sphingomonas]|uniref:STAS-like domain-containing protein n=1 Tax=unclassified Sphingomonas TaxID=196159 RepID=UPI0006FF13F2|nr:MULTISPECIES: DUF4325 domain-containing protein [unclassified Sphingomonas]KQX19053.1 hypothetical protein ASD17_10800 [Sphingomonas sp. Root1294]KQY65254.1 hypothetical protein ASD39_13995 [Sphingomonas sp. Root50]KRB95452.1 hypothetical protein ASE22_06060 [Sphingomonas sp. Root720]
MVVRALDHVRQCYSSADGAVINHVLRDAFAQDSKVTLSFDGVVDIPSSFVNAALVPLLDEVSFDWLKSHLAVVDANRQIADMVRRCLGNASRTNAA